MRLVYSSLVSPEQTLEAVWPPSERESDEAAAAEAADEADVNFCSGYPRHIAVQRLVKQLPAPGYDASTTPGATLSLSLSLSLSLQTGNEDSEETDVVTQV